jgi:hypothetical protein
VWTSDESADDPVQSVLRPDLNGSLSDGAAGAVTCCTNLKRNQLFLFLLSGLGIDIESLQNRLRKVFYVPATSAHLPRLLFLLRPLTVLMKKTRQTVHAVKQSMLP